MTTILLILFIHWVSDFIVQTDWVAINKSKRNEVLLLHVTLYDAPLFLFGWKFALVNMGLHFITDFFTSRLTSYLWKKEMRHWFFVVIGFDQFVHTACLLVTAQYFGVI